MSSKSWSTKFPHAEGKEKTCLPWAYGLCEESFSSRGLIFEGFFNPLDEEIYIPETRRIRKLERLPQKLSNFIVMGYYTPDESRQFLLPSTVKSFAFFQRLSSVLATSFLTKATLSKMSEVILWFQVQLLF